MNLTRLVTASFLIFLALISFTSAQDSKDKENNKSKLKTIDVKINLMVLNSEKKFIDDVKLEDVKIFEDGVEQKITYFTRKTPILNVGLVFDTSGSMRNNLNEIIAMGKVIVDNLNQNDEAFVVYFTDSDNIAMTQDWTSDKAALNDALENLFIQGGQTAVLDAIYLAATKLLEREKKDSSKRYAIILMSDAEERDSYYKFDQVADLFRGTNLQVFLLSYAENAPLKKKTAGKLTNLIPFEIGGMSYSIPKKHTNEELTGGLKAIVTELFSNYVVGYTSTNSQRDGLPRKLSVQINDGAGGEKRAGIIRENFIVPKD